MDVFFIVLIAILAIIGMILTNIFIPTITIKKFSFTTFWIFPLLGAGALLIFQFLNVHDFVAGLVADSAINPLEILCLFFAMTFMSIVLDEVGFFEKMASWASKKAKGDQFKLFVILYLITSILTIFTSNDIIIITFTPFIIFFTKRAKIDPVPYLVGEFVAANTWSLLLIISNPTNIYLASSYSVTFLDYLSSMWLATLLVGIISFTIMILLFHKKLKKPLESTADETKIKDRITLIISLFALTACIILMAISSYLDLKMWLISLIAAGVLLTFLLVYACIKKETFKIVLGSFKRLPYDLIPFIISMFAIVLAFDRSGIVQELFSFLNNDYPLLTYGATSFLSANFINNIPMSVLFTNIISHIPDITMQLKAMYVVVAGSNIGAFLTPFGALAGMMWMSILKKHKIKFSFLDFIKYGAIISTPTMLAAILGIYLIVH